MKFKTESATGTIVLDAKLCDDGVWRIPPIEVTRTSTWTSSYAWPKNDEPIPAEYVNQVRARLDQDMMDAIRFGFMFGASGQKKK